METASLVVTIVSVRKNLMEIRVHNLEYACINLCTLVRLMTAEISHDEVGMYMNRDLAQSSSLMPRR